MFVYVLGLFFFFLFPREIVPVFLFNLSLFYSRWYGAALSQKHSTRGNLWGDTVLLQGLVNKTSARSSTWGANQSSPVVTWDHFLTRGASSIWDSLFWCRGLCKNAHVTTWRVLEPGGGRSFPRAPVPALERLRLVSGMDSARGHTARPKPRCAVACVWPSPPPPKLIYSRSICVFWIIILLWNIYKYHCWRKPAIWTMYI